MTDQERPPTMLERILTKLVDVEEQIASLRTDLGIARLAANPGEDTDAAGAGRAMLELNARRLEHERAAAPYAPVAPADVEASA